MTDPKALLDLKHCESYHYQLDMTFLERKTCWKVQPSDGFFRKVNRAALAECDEYLIVVIAMNSLI